MRICKPAGSILHCSSKYVLQNFPDMSVTSSTTVSQDREVQSPDPLPDKLLVVSIAKRDGTLLDASSISEEDIVELCIGRAHTHPLGVLRYSAADSVVFLSSATDVNCTQCALLDVTEFGDEAVAIWTMAPTEVQITTFQAMWCLNPTAGAGEAHTLPYRTPPNEETPRRMHAQLGDLNDDELQQLVRICHRRLHNVNQQYPPAIPLQGTGHVLRAMWYQKRVTRRSPF